MMDKDMTDVLRQYSADTGMRSVHQVVTDFEHLAQVLPPETLTSGLSEAFRSGQTPAFEQALGQSYEQGDQAQRAAVLDRLLDAAGPGTVRGLQEKGVLPKQVGPEVASQLRPELVEEIASVACRNNPHLIDRLSDCYAADPSLARTLGGATLNVALEKIAQQH